MLLFLDFDGVLRRKHGSRLSFTVWCLISTTHRFGWLSCQSEAIFVCTNSRAGIQPRRVHALGPVQHQPPTRPAALCGPGALNEWSARRRSTPYFVDARDSVCLTK